MGSLINGVTHLVTGLTIGVSLGYTKPLELAIIGVASLLPDIDRSQSLLGRYIPFAPTLIKWLLGKRTFTHSFIFCGLILGFLWNSGQTNIYLFMLGFGSHVVLDLLTGYVGVFFPFGKKVTLTVGVSPMVVETIYVLGLGAVFATNHSFFLKQLSNI